MENVTIDDLMQRVIDADKQYDADKIRRAYDLADKAHDGQMRSSGEKYLEIVRQSDQSIGCSPQFFRNSFAFTKCPQPKNPPYAESGLG